MTMESPVLDLVRTVLQLAYLLGYAVPLVLLLGWYPNDALLWYVTIEALVAFAVYWVEYTFETHRHLRPQAVLVSHAALSFMNACATIGIGILANMYYYDHTGGHVEIVLAVIVASRVLYQTFNNDALLASLAGAEEVDTSAPIRTTRPPPATKSALKRYPNDIDDAL